MAQLLMRFDGDVCKVYKDGKHVMDITKDDMKWLEKHWSDKKAERIIRI